MNPIRATRQQAGQRQQYLTFVLKRGLFAVSILRIKEIIEYGQFTVVPMMPGFVRGVINLRGAVVPVMDLLARFGQEPSPMTKRTCIVIIEIEMAGVMQDIGVLVDAVNGVDDIAAGDIEPAPRFGSSIRAEFISGMGKVNNGFVVILDLNCLFSEEELHLVEQACATGAPGAP